MAAARGILALAATITTIAMLSLHTHRRNNAPTQCLAGAASGYAVSADATVVVVGVAESSHAAPVFRATVTALDGAGKFLALYSPESVAAVDGCGAALCVAVVAAGHPGAAELRVALFAEYASLEAATRGPTAAKTAVVPFLGAPVLEVRAPAAGAAAAGRGTLSALAAAHDRGAPAPFAPRGGLGHCGAAARRRRASGAAAAPPAAAALRRARGRWTAAPAAAATLFSDAPRNRTCASRDGGPFEAAVVADAFEAAGRRSAAAFAAAYEPPPAVAWAPDGCALRRFTVRGARQCLRRRRVVFFGDSVTRHAASFLECELGFSGDVRYVPFRGTLPANGSAFRSQLAAGADAAGPGATALLNFAGLWQCAYGDVDVYQNAVAELLADAKRRFAKVFLVATTAVFPHQLFGVAACDRKYSTRDDVPHHVAQGKRTMTEPRVEALNDAASAAARALGVHVVDAWSPTALASSDPLVPGDMRHHGPATTTAVAATLLDAACASALAPGVEVRPQSSPN